MEINEKLNLFVERYFDNIAKMEEYNHLISEIITDEEKHNPTLVHMFHEKIDKMLDCIYYEMVEEVILHLHRADGIEGTKWSFEDVESVMEDYRLSDHFKDHIKKLEFWYLMNKVHAIHFNPNRHLDFYLDIAKEILESENDCISEEIKKKFNRIKHTEAE
jgi:rubrerythrin